MFHPGLPWKESTLSPTQHWIEKCSVATHISARHMSVPNIRALSPPKARGLLSPCLLCAHGCERLNRGKAPYRVRPRSLSIGVVSPRAKGISIETAAQTAHRERKGGKHSTDFLFESGISVLDGIGIVSRKVLSLLQYLGISRAASTTAFMWNYIITKFSADSEWAFECWPFWFKSFFVPTLAKLPIQTSYLVSSWVTNPYCC